MERKKYYGATRMRWRRLAAAAWVLLAVACSAAMHWHLRRESMDRAEERLVSMCGERARMLQEQFGVTVNHVHALAILISTFHYEKQPSAIDQVHYLLMPLLFLSAVALTFCIEWFGDDGAVMEILRIALLLSVFKKSMLCGLLMLTFQ
jgi:hypothetical protein